MPNMAVLPGFQFFRSFSLPSRLHPVKSPKFEFQLQKLKSPHNSNSSNESAPVTSTTIQSDLFRLAELCTALQEVKFKPFPGDVETLEHCLESSIKLLDSCILIKETVSMIRDNAQSLQSALRRKATTIQDDVSSYLIFRKKTHNHVLKSVKKLKHYGSSINDDHGEGDNYLSLLKFLTGFAVAVFNSVLDFLSRPAASRSRVSTRVVVRSSGGVRRNNCWESEVGRVDCAVRSLQGRIRDDCVGAFDAEMVQKELGNLENAMEGIEKGLDRLSRLFVQIRVTLLNIITNDL